jgi:hypothetical protein
MGVITGISAAINGLTCLEQFTIDSSGIDNAVACGDSKGGVVRVDTNYDWEGVAVGFGHTPPKLPGEVFTFTGSDRAGQGWVSAANGAILDRAKIFCRPDNADAIYHHLKFSGNGSLTPGAYLATSSATPGGISSKERGIKILSSSVADYYAGAGNIVSGIAGWDLEIIGNTTDPLWTSTSGGWPNRGAGNIDAIITWQHHFDSMGALPTLGSFAEFRLYVTASTYWTVKWAQVLQLPTQYVIRNKQNKPEWVRTDGVAKFSGYYGGVEGYIKRPAGTTYWPAA